MADYFLMEGNKFLKKHDFKRALALADSAELYAIKKDDVYFFKGRIYSELGRFSKADQAYNNTINNIRPIGMKQLIFIALYQQYFL